MLAVRVVLDTNIIVSAALKPQSLPRTVFTLAVTPPARFFLSPLMLQEYAEVLARPELRIRAPIRDELLELISRRGSLITPTIRIEASPDPQDNIFLECADAARADYLITGNQRHFPRFWKATKVISAREFVLLTAPHLLG